MNLQHFSLVYSLVYFHKTKKIKINILEIKFFKF